MIKNNSITSIDFVSTNNFMKTNNSIIIKNLKSIKRIQYVKKTSAIIKCFQNLTFKNKNKIDQIKRKIIHNDNVLSTLIII